VRKAGRENDMVNRVILVGRLTRDPEIVTSPKGLTIAKLRLATNSYSKDDDGNRQEDVQYHSLVAFDRLASICQEFLTRGKLIYAEGRLRSHEWDGKDGLRRYTTEVVMDQMKMLSPKTESPVENSQPVPEPVGA
jgi:single-strand DNA-binding protein